MIEGKERAKGTDAAFAGPLHIMLWLVIIARCMLRSRSRSPNIYNYISMPSLQKYNAGNAWIISWALVHEAEANKWQIVTCVDSVLTELV